MSKARAKGTRFESEMRDYLTPVWADIARTGSKAYERADLENTDDFVFECKNVKKLSPSAWLKQAHEAADRIDDAQFPIVLASRRGYSAGDNYCLMTVETFRNLAAELLDLRTRARTVSGEGLQIADLQQMAALGRAVATHILENHQ